MGKGKKGDGKREGRMGSAGRACHVCVPITKKYHYTAAADQGLCPWTPQGVRSPTPRPPFTIQIAATVQNYAPDRPTCVFFHKMLVALKRADFTRRRGSDWLQQQKRNYVQNLTSKLQHQSMHNYAADRPTCVFFQNKNEKAEHSKKKHANVCAR